MGLQEHCGNRYLQKIRKNFLDYYYTEKTKNNEIYVIETDHDIRAMMQLNPYVIQMGKKAVESRYIVAVATESSLPAQRL